MRRSSSNPNEELAESFTKAYEGTLRPHHNMLIRPIFAVRLLYTSPLTSCQADHQCAYGHCSAMKACPYRKVFDEKVGGDAATREAWLSALESQVAIIKKQLEANKITA